MAQFASYNKLMISEPDGLKVFKEGDAVLGLEFKLRYPSYRGTYLSCIEALEIRIDG